MNFSQALERIKWGQPMTRAKWEDLKTYVHRLNGDDNDKINLHYSSGAESLWSPTTEDVLADDWQDTSRVA